MKDVYGTAVFVRFDVPRSGQVGHNFTLGRETDQPLEKHRAYLPLGNIYDQCGVQLVGSGFQSELERVAR